MQGIVEGDESVNAQSHEWYFRQCQENAELLQQIEVIIPVRPADGINCNLAKMLSMWLMAGVRWSMLNDHMGGFIELTRANIAHEWTHEPYSGIGPRPKYLLMIDNDMEPPLNLPYLLARHDKPIVSACAMAIHEEDGPRLCFTMRCEDGKYRFPAMRKVKIPPHGLVTAGQAGTGAMLIRRDVLEAFSYDMFCPECEFRLDIEGAIESLARDEAKFVPPVECPRCGKALRSDVPFYVPEFIRVLGASRGRLLIGEDLAFCQQAKTKGFSCYVDLEAHCGHRKTMTMRWDSSRVDPNLRAETWILPKTSGGALTELPRRTPGEFSCGEDTD